MSERRLNAHPLLYEINTRCWLRRLTGQQGRVVTLNNVPDEEFDRWQELAFTHIWAMGAWTTGPRSRALALESTERQAQLTNILPGWSKHDVPGSPYAIADYEVPAALGGDEGLKYFRHQLNARGLKLLLDFVPNHLGLDHTWVGERSELFVQSPVEMAGAFQQKTRAGLRWLAHGKDPNFPHWNDTVQLNYRRPETRAAMIELLQSIAKHCDGVRCDMAMLQLNDVFAQTWVHLPETVLTPTAEFWAVAIQAVQQSHPNFLFLAEAYWGLEARLQELGFDYTYAKSIYDHLLDRNHTGLQKHLLAFPRDQLAASTHFLENHDECRIASVFSAAEHRAAALLMLSLPGMRMVYEGQLQGARIQAPVHLGRWPEEVPDMGISAMYKQLLTVLKDSVVGRGDWHLLATRSCSENQSVPHTIVIQWQETSQAFELVVVNLTAQSSQCRVELAVQNLAAHGWEMRDLLGTEIHRHKGAELQTHGLCLNLPAHGAQLLRFRQI